MPILDFIEYTTYQRPLDLSSKGFFVNWIVTELACD